MKMSVNLTQPSYVMNAKGQPEAVLIDIATWRIILERLQDLADNEIIYHSDKCPDLICTETVQSIDPILAEIQQRMITESIENKDIRLLDRAAESAQKHFEEFFKSLGHEEVRIIIDRYPM
jgi:hypothetical protein